MPKPAHIPQKAWDKAQEMLEKAPGMWESRICAGGYISAKGEAVDSKYSSCWTGAVCHAFMMHPDDDGDYDYDDDDDDFDEDEDYDDDY